MNDWAEIPNKPLDLVQQLHQNGGFSVSPDLRPAPQSGYYASEYGGHEIPVDEFGEHHIMDMQGKLEPHHYMGAWLDNGTVYLDKSHRFDNVQDALDFGRLHKQLAIYDANTGNVIDVPPEPHVAQVHESMPWADQGDPESWQDEPGIRDKRNQSDWTELQPKDEYANEDWSDPQEVLRQHLQSLADTHGVNLKYWGTNPSYNKTRAIQQPYTGELTDRKVQAAHIISPQHYMAALHEFGHQLAGNECMGSRYDEDWNVVPYDAKTVLGKWFYGENEQGGQGPLKRLTPQGHAGLEEEARAWKWALQNAKLQPTPNIQRMMHQWMNSYIPRDKIRNTYNPEFVNPVPPTWKELRETYPEGSDFYHKLRHERSEAPQTPPNGTGVVPGTTTSDWHEAGLEGVTAANTDYVKLGAIEEWGKEEWQPGDTAHFEYHCNPSHDSPDAPAWYRSQQPVTVLGRGDDEAHNYPEILADERAEAGIPKVYHVQFGDGLKWDAFEDELYNHPRWYVPENAPPSEQSSTHDKTSAQQVMYHVAPRSARESILANGLDSSLGGSDGWNVLTEDPREADTFAEHYRSVEPQEHDTWQVDPTGLDLEPDPDYTEGGIAGTWRTNRPIPPDRLRLLSEGTTAKTASLQTAPWYITHDDRVILGDWGQLHEAIGADREGGDFAHKGDVSPEGKVTIYDRWNGDERVPQDENYVYNRVAPSIRGYHGIEPTLLARKNWGIADGGTVVDYKPGNLPRPPKLAGLSYKRLTEMRDPLEHASAAEYPLTGAPGWSNVPNHTMEWLQTNKPGEEFGQDSDCINPKCNHNWTDEEQLDLAKYGDTICPDCGMMQNRNGTAGPIEDAENDSMTRGKPTNKLPGGGFARSGLPIIQMGNIGEELVARADMLPCGQITHHFGGSGVYNNPVDFTSVDQHGNPWGIEVKTIDARSGPRFKLGGSGEVQKKIKYCNDHGLRQGLIGVRLNFYTDEADLFWRPQFTDPYLGDKTMEHVGTLNFADLNPFRDPTTGEHHVPEQQYAGDLPF